eukprot:gene5659-7045_t
MADLRQSLSDNPGFKNVQTYIQSGNIILESSLTKDQLIQNIETILRDDFNIKSPQMAVFDELLYRDIMTIHNPFHGEQDFIGSIYFKINQFETIEILKHSIENEGEWVAGDHAIYVKFKGNYNCPLFKLLEKQTKKISVTNRNINTCKKLIQLLSSPPPTPQPPLSTKSTKSSKSKSESNNAIETNITIDTTTLTTLLPTLNYSIPKTRLKSKLEDTIRKE